MFFLYIFSAPVRCLHTFPRPRDPAACAGLIACLASHLAEFWEEICDIWRRQDYIPPDLPVSVETMRDQPDLEIGTEAEASESTLVVDSEDPIALLPPPQDVVHAAEPMCDTPDVEIGTAVETLESTL